MNNEKPDVQDPSKEERLLKAIFSGGYTNEDDPDDNYLDTIKEKVGYSEYAATQTLGDIGKALHRLSRLYSLLLVAEKDGKNELPDIITNNEARMALESLSQVKNNIKDAVELLAEVYRETKVEPTEGAK